MKGFLTYFFEEHITPACVAYCVAHFGLRIMNYFGI